MNNLITMSSCNNMSATVHELPNQRQRRSGTATGRVNVNWYEANAYAT